MADTDSAKLKAAEAEVSELRQQAHDLEEEVNNLRRRVQDAPKRVRTLEEKLLEAKGQLAQAVSQNEKLTYTLREAREHIAALRDEVDKLTQPPSAYGTFLDHNDDGTIDVFSGGRKMRVALHPELNADNLKRGDEVALNESLNVVLARAGERSGEVVVLKELLDEKRAMITGRADEERVVELAQELIGEKLRSGDTMLMDTRTGLLLEKLPRPEVEELLLEEVPDVSYEDVGGLDSQIELITDAVELPFLHKDLFHEYELPAPKGILLYGPPGCGKTLIAKAVANSLAKKVREQSSGKDGQKAYFINIKGPELLNKYVGETERQIRLVFQRAREKSEDGMPVIVFFDEMDSLFRTRGTGISSDMESTIVPQLLAEIDGVEQLKNVIVIGASNREDLIDPAILRPGRLDVKIKIERPDAAAAEQIFNRYINDNLPIDEGEIKKLGKGDRNKAVQAMIEKTVDNMYDTGEENRFIEVTYQNGDKEVMYFKDFSSGAMIENIVRKAKKSAVKRQIAGDGKGITLDHLVQAVRDEFRENEDLPNSTNPDDWAKISGKKGERIVFLRVLIPKEGGEEGEEGGRAIERVATGQYL